MRRKRRAPEQIIRKLRTAEQHRLEYNTYRPHSALQGRTPLEGAQAAAA